VCVFKKYIVLVPLRDKTAVSVAKSYCGAFILEIWCWRILTDNGGEHRCELLNENMWINGRYEMLYDCLPGGEPMQFVRGVTPQ